MARRSGLQFPVILVMMVSLQCSIQAFLLPPVLPALRSTNSLRPAGIPAKGLSLQAISADASDGRDATSEGQGTAGERERGGGVAVKTKTPDVETAPKPEEKTSDFEGNWQVLLHRDEWKTLDYGQEAIMTVVPMISHQKAHRIAMQAHMKGVAHVVTAPKQLAREISLGFHALGFTSSIVPSKNKEAE